MDFRQIAIAAALCFFGSGGIRAEGPADALSSCGRALADVRAGSQFVRLERRGEHWQVVHISLSGFDNTFDIGQLAPLSSVESVVLDEEFGIRSPFAFSNVDRLTALRNLRRLSICPRDFTSKLAKVLASLPRLEDLSLGRLDRDSRKQVLLAVRELPKLRRLNLIWIGPTEGLSELLKPLTDLEELHLGLHGALTDDALGALKPLEQLRVLNLRTDDHITDSGLVRLKHLGELRHLALGETRLGPVGIAALEALPHLESLRYTCDAGPGENDLSGLRGLVSLNIGVGPGKHVRLPESLRQLDIFRHDIPNLDLGLSRQIESAFVQWSARSKKAQPELAGLLALPRLKRLKMRGASDHELKAISGLASLEELYLEHSGQCDDLLGYGYSDEGVASLAGLRQLQSFKSDSRCMTDDGLAVLPNFKLLRRLELVIGSDATEAGMESIRELKRLQFLRLRSESEDSVDRLFAIASELSELEDLEIPGSITDAGLMQLGALKKLQRLNLTYNEGYSDVALAALIRMLPNLQEVRRFFRREQGPPDRIQRFKTRGEQEEAAIPELREAEGLSQR